MSPQQPLNKEAQIWVSLPFILWLVTSFLNHFHLEFLGAPGGERTTVPKPSHGQGELLRATAGTGEKVICIQDKPQEEKGWKGAGQQGGQKRR